VSGPNFAMLHTARLGAALALAAGVASALPSGPSGPSYVLVARADDKEVATPATVAPRTSVAGEAGVRAASAGRVGTGRRTRPTDVLHPAGCDAPPAHAQADIERAP
jgi:hypothetical protein